MKRLWHHYLKWEEVNSPMWRRSPKNEHDLLLQVAIEFTGNSKKYGDAMLQVLVNWPISCEHNLTDQNQNRQAWIGHAACAITIECPEYIVREAWGQLTQIQRDEANEVADFAIAEFEEQHAAKNSVVYRQMEITGLSRWHTRRSTSAIGSLEPSPIIPCDLHRYHQKRQAA